MRIYPRAVCLLIRRKMDGKILAVSRKDDRTKFGLIGGKVDPGETDIEAILRETEEEGGIVPKSPRLVYVAVCPGDVTYICATFFAEGYVGTPHTNEAIELDWKDPEILVEGPFGDYNLGLFETLGIPLRGRDRVIEREVVKKS